MLNEATDDDFGDNIVTIQMTSSDCKCKWAALNYSVFTTYWVSEFKATTYSKMVKMMKIRMIVKGLAMGMS